MSFVPAPFFRAILSCAILALAVTAPVRADADPDRTAKLNGGYYLLHKVCDDESNVPMLFLVKHAPDEISRLADRVSATAKESLAALDRMQDADPAIRFDQNPLPPIERDVRESIKGDKQHQLLFGTTGSEFVRHFLVSQIEASTYALNLTKVLADQETNPRRAKALRHLSGQWLRTRDEVTRLLGNY